MNNAILFYFNINVSNVKKINGNYYFNYLNNNYVVYFYNRDINDSIHLYNLNLELHNRGISSYDILLTKNREIIFLYENKYYVLMRYPNINNRIISYEDIKNFNIEVSKKYKTLDKSNWSNSWSNKIDFIEYQFDQMKNKYPKINAYIDYYIGLWENAISYFNNNPVFNKRKYICHKRVYVNMDLYEFLNPINFVVDYKERDIAEYLKSVIFTKNFSFNTIDKYLNNLSRDNIILIISRLLFPTYFFDLYEDIIIDKLNEDEIDSIILKNSNIINTLKYIFNRFSYMNIAYISWIKKETS